MRILRIIGAIIGGSIVGQVIAIVVGLGVAKETANVWMVVFMMAGGFAGAYWAAKRAGTVTKAEITPEPKISISTSVSSSSFEVPNTGAVCATQDGGWILNPKATFSLTIYGVDGPTVNQLKTILDHNSYASLHKQASELTPLIACSHFRCKEIDEYVREFKPCYLDKIEQLKRYSSEWTLASEKDREDLLAGFRQEAIKALDVKPGCDLEILLEHEPTEGTADDALLDRFGYDNLQLYLRYVGNLEKVRVVPADHYDRIGFETLCDVGLAIRGAEIPLPAILEDLKLKEMGELVKDLGVPPFRRKSQAVEFLLSLPDLKERISKTVAFRELFQLRPLPQEFSQLNLSRVSAAWRHAHEVATCFLPILIRWPAMRRGTESYTNKGRTCYT